MSTELPAPTFTIREVLRTSLALIRARPKLLIGAAFICALPELAGQVFIAHDLKPAARYGEIANGSAWVVLYTVVSTIVASAMLGVVLGLAAEVAVSAHGGVHEPSGAIIRRTLARIPHLTGVTFLVSLASFFGAMCFVLPGIYARVVFALAPAVCVIERVGPIRALAFSEQLTEGMRLRVAGLLFLVHAPMLVWIAFRVGFALFIAITLASESDSSFAPMFAAGLREDLSDRAAVIAYALKVFVSLFGGVCFGVVYAHAARVPVASTFEKTVETFA